MIGLEGGSPRILSLVLASSPLGVIKSVERVESNGNEDASREGRW
jgi:hypothetical protein